jgi:hypothetical protein
MASRTKDYLADLTDLDLKMHQALLDDGNTKRSRAFQFLKKHKGKWLSMPILAAHMNTRSIASVIQGLRQFGCDIDNRTEKQGSMGLGQTNECKSWYSLRREPKDILAEREADPKANLP